MAGISPKLPLTRDRQDGFALNKTVLDSIKQNVKMVVLTSPGERVMDPAFGVGVRRYLFENGYIMSLMMWLQNCFNLHETNIYKWRLVEPTQLSETTLLFGWVDW